ncbi:MAG: fibronectin type III domain-containing protein [Lachnospiraceae bacterium]|nr:fibronectin type III domain-containing protein [Lachnospiraceae bacterium]
MKRIRRSIVHIAMAFSLILTLGALTAVYGTVKEVNVNSGAERGGGYISVNEDIGGDCQLILAGLKEKNKDAVVSAVAENYSEGTGDVLRIVDDALPDAEKYDCNEADEGFDDALCWAASASNMLWMSGWASSNLSINNPRTGMHFKSEDEIFDYYTDCFTDAGGDIDRAIDWFFMGEYTPRGVSRSTGMKDPNDDSQGLLKNYVSTMDQEQYVLTGSAGEIQNLNRLDWQGSGEDAVIQGGLGMILDGEAYTDSMHSVTIAGFIMDPFYWEPKDRYKAVAIIDSDNDGFPEESGSIPPDEKMEQRAKRPNSFTIYDLKYGTDVNGKEYWEVVNYSNTDRYSLNNLNLLKLPGRGGWPSEEGTKNAFQNVDFTVDILFTTGNERSIMMPADHLIEDATKTEFYEGEPVNLNYFLTNRANVSYDENYEGFGDLRIGWEVKDEESGVIVAGGTEMFKEPVYQRTDAPALISLNYLDGQPVQFRPGRYNVALTLNSGRDGDVVESYYSNNGVKQLEFTVLPAEDIPGGQISPQVILSKSSYVYNGKARKPSVTVKSGADVISPDNYDVIYPSGRKNVGTYQVTVKMKGDYSGTLSASFRIDPKGTSLKTVKGSSKSITVKWTPQKTKMSKSHITGYQIQTATNPSFTKSKTTTPVKGYKSSSKKLTGLKAGKKYYVRIRTYKTVNGKKYYSAWSKKKSVRI